MKKKIMSNDGIVFVSLPSHFAYVSYVKYESGETKEEIVSYLQNILILALWSTLFCSLNNFAQ